MCSFMDPRTRQLTHLPQTQRAKVSDRVHARLAALVEEEKKQVSNGDTSAIQGENSTEAGRTLLSPLLPDFSATSTTSADLIASDEIRLYLRVADCKMDDSALDW